MGFFRFLVSSTQLGYILPPGYFWAWGYYHILAKKIRHTKITETLPSRDVTDIWVLAHFEFKTPKTF